MAGHGHLLAARLLGMTQVPTITLEHLSESQVRAFIIADNRLTENATWDDRLVAEQLKVLSEQELNFSVDVTGFEIGEIDVMIEGLAPGHNGKQDPFDAIPEIPKKLRVCSSGNLWKLGWNRVFSGNALDASTYERLLRDARAPIVFADPPYNVPIDGLTTGLGRIKHCEFEMASGEMTAREFRNFLTQAFDNLAEYSSDGSLHYICMDWRHMGELLAAGRHAFSGFMNLCIWTKDNGGMGSMYRSQHELIFVFKSGKAPHRNNVELGQFGRDRTNVWQYPGVNSFSGKTEEGNLLEFHPTVNPVAHVADAILDGAERYCLGPLPRKWHLHRCRGADRPRLVRD